MLAVAVLATIIVSIYTLTTHRRLSKNTVQPSPVLQQQNELRSINIQRINDDPNMFFPAQNRKQRNSAGASQPNVIINEEHTNQCFDQKAFLQMLKLTMKINLSTLVTMMVVVPFFTLGIINLHCDVKKGECDSFILMFTSLNHIRVFFISIQIVIVFKNLVLL